jgi:dTDP-4-amino-4,6-dideoxygalactose transaminase
MESMKRAAGRAVGAMDVPRAKIGDIGFNIEDIDLAMSEISVRLLNRIDFEAVRRRRIDNYRRLARQLETYVTPLHEELPEGACPLFFPILVDDKPETADMLRTCGVDVLEFWNYGAEMADRAGSTAHDLPTHAQFLREHVLGLPIHQDLTPRHIDYIAEQVSKLNVRMS